MTSATSLVRTGYIILANVVQAGKTGSYTLTLTRGK